jgi:hypothetical protein
MGSSVRAVLMATFARRGSPRCPRFESPRCLRLNMSHRATVGETARPRYDLCDRPRPTYSQRCARPLTQLTAPCAQRELPFGCCTTQSRRGECRVARWRAARSARRW